MNRRPNPGFRLSAAVPAPAPAPAPVVGAPIDRVDGRLKVTGGAKYAVEYPVDRIVHAVMITSTIAKGRVKSINVDALMKMPGVIAVLTPQNAPKLSGAGGTAGAAAGAGDTAGTRAGAAGSHVGWWAGRSLGRRARRWRRRRDDERAACAKRRDG